MNQNKWEELAVAKIYNRAAAFYTQFKKSKKHNSKGVFSSRMM